MRKTLFALISIVALAGLASAQNNFAQNHPRRAQVNHRANRAAASGKITKAQAAKDKREQRALARRNGGRITKAQQAQLNARINRQGARDAGH